MKQKTKRTIQVYVPEDIRLKAEKLAEKEGLGLSAFVRRLIIREVSNV